jgi:hypothetical protein
MKTLLENPEIAASLAQIVVAAIGVIGAFLTPLLLRLYSATGAVAGEKEQQLIQQIADQVVHYAEEWAANKIKGGEVPSGEEKLAVAIDAAKQLATGALTKYADDKWAVAIQAKVPAMRAKLSAPPAISPT